MTIAQLMAQIRGQMATKLTERNKKATELNELRAQDAPDEAKVTELRAAKDALDGELDAMQERVKSLEEEQARDDAADRLQREVAPGAARPPAYDQVARVGAEARTYRPDQDRNGKKFLWDVTRAHANGDYEARERLDRHMAEERVERAQYLQRATGTGNFTGLTVPQYLTDMYAPATAAVRPFADEACTPHELPESGMTVEISRITTASSVALQANQNDAASETNMDDTPLSIPVQTAAGQQTISRQAIDRGTGIDDVTLQDLFKRYATTLDSTLITQATTGLSAIAQAVAYTDASPTAAELYPKILNANANVEAALLAQAMPTHVTMHSRRWNWLQSQVSSTWPFISQPSIPTQAGGVNTGAGYGKGVRGVLPNGMLVIVDNNIATNLGAGTNEDEIYVTPKDECHLWEDPNAPLYIRAEQVKAANLGVLLVVYGYFAYTFGRYTNGMGKVGGTGLVAPTF
ncbi:hypothetical protein [Lentzea albida]|uniref:Phage major capsid protein, HK97 family n=1 Tax=Lentzea albida TaxID=65499 RepID=A0A1H9VGT6_9PSEU|nr:hypothetical protein [Lentzea albida]SES20996.1 phage major capsid protein, HK97 family [Lentzea albida]